MIAQKMSAEKVWDARKSLKNDTVNCLNIKVINITKVNERNTRK